MKNLSASLLIEKNRLNSGSPWLVLVDIYFADDLIIRLVRNSENITFGGVVYTAFPMEIQLGAELIRGEIPTVTLKVSNITRVIQGYISALSGGIDCPVTIFIVNADCLEDDYAELTLDYLITGVTANAEWITFTLGLPSPINYRFPLYRYFPESCNWAFKSAECGYSGSASVCHRNFVACGQLGNTKRFGGFIGLNRSGVSYA
jgi:Phage-related protein